MSWSDGFIGIPWSRGDHGMKSTHCWGLVRLAFAERFGITLADYGPAQGLAVDASAIAAHRDVWPWRKVEHPQDGDVVVIRNGVVDDHVGVMVGRRLMLHVQRGKSAELVEVDTPQWRNRVSGFYRHASVGDDEHV
ncbi:NlpC/P60 family protein [Kaistia soli DSM 19436]|uniref:NlpC/P60 family protein n=1 Tax=Kaistia soli DSM 19436 TaxID=1122133 RepID=A0A1M5MSA8_9HYPH|nr:NlpC/P60 family protein [Kaistia soli]SHG80095.1 NlpC/P60 family protein [Kaistia soli DSM 19436]